MGVGEWGYQLWLAIQIPKASGGRGMTIGKNIKRQQSGKSFGMATTYGYSLSNVWDIALLSTY